MKKISIFNLKGGVGKTTTTINLSYALAQSGKKILIIDMDPQTNTTPVFSNQANTHKTIKDVLDNGCIGKAIYRSRYKNIDIIEGDPELTEKYDFKTLANILKTVTGYNYILIDCRPSFENLTKNAVYASDIVLTPVVMDRFCLDNLKLVKRHLKSLEGHTVDWKIFANRIKKVKSQLGIYREIMQLNDYSFLDACIQERAAITNALVYRKPIMLHRKTSPAAQDFFELADEIRGV